jgi:hypothetical protein
MELKFLLPCLKETDTGSYPEPDESNPHHTEFVFLEYDFTRVESNVRWGE